MTEVDALTFALFAIEYQKREQLNATIFDGTTAADRQAAREAAGAPFDDAKSTLAELRRRLREEKRNVASSV